MSPAVRKMLLSYRDKMIAEGRAEGSRKGLYEGRREGRRAGVLKGKRSALARQLKRKFGPSPRKLSPESGPSTRKRLTVTSTARSTPTRSRRWASKVRCQSQLPFAETGCTSGRRRGKLLAGAPS